LGSSTSALHAMLFCAKFALDGAEVVIRDAKVAIYAAKVAVCSARVV